MPLDTVKNPIKNPIKLLKQKYHVSFDWLGKEYVGRLIGDLIIINLEFLITQIVIHEMYHGESKDLPVDYDEEEVVVELRESKYMERYGAKTIRKIAQHVIKYNLIPYLLDEYITKEYKNRYHIKRHKKINKKCFKSRQQ